jgi:hypothetical protein
MLGILRNGFNVSLLLLGKKNIVFVCAESICHVRKLPIIKLNRFILPFASQVASVFWF